MVSKVELTSETLKVVGDGENIMKSPLETYSEHSIINETVDNKTQGICSGQKHDNTVDAREARCARLAELFYKDVLCGRNGCGGPLSSSRMLKLTMLSQVPRLLKEVRELLLKGIKYMVCATLTTTACAMLIAAPGVIMYTVGYALNLMISGIHI